jgi:hypothetical protein
VPEGDHAIKIVVTSACSASVVVRKHCGFISALTAFGWTIPYQRFDHSDLDTEDRTPGESPASPKLHIGTHGG